MNQTSSAEVRRVALNFWNSLDFGLDKEAGFRVDLEAYRAARDLTQEIASPPESRVDDQGHPLDLFAPTVWHGLCLLMYFFVRTRLKDSAFDDPHELDKLFGTQLLYRGQSRGWNIVPSIWRSPEQQNNQKRLEELRNEPTHGS